MSNECENCQDSFIIGIFSSLSSLKPPRSEEGSRDEIPCQGLGDEIPNVTQSKKNKNRSGAEGDNYDSAILLKRDFY